MSENSGEMTRTYYEEIEDLKEIGETSVWEISTDRFDRFVLPVTFERPEGSNTILHLPDYDREGFRSDDTALLATDRLQVMGEKEIFSYEEVREVLEGKGTPIIKAGHVHTDQMHIPSLTKSIIGIQRGEIAVPNEIKNGLVRRASALLFGQATMAYFISDSNLGRQDNELYHYGQFYVDVDGIESDQYVLTNASFQKTLAMRGVPTIDIHDFVHHAEQFRTWPDVFIPFYNMGYLINNAALESPEREDLVRFKHLISYLSFVMAEYSIIGEQPDKSASFGCLLFQYPRKSPVAKIDTRSDQITPRNLTDWNMVRSLMSLHRRAQVVEHSIKQKIDWFTEMGYKLPDAYIPEVNERGSVIREPISQLRLSDSIDFEHIALPEDAQALFERAKVLLQKEASKLGSFSGKANFEQWLDEFTIPEKV